MKVTHRAWPQGADPGGDLFEAAGMYLPCPGDITIDWSDIELDYLKSDLITKSMAQVDDGRVGIETLDDIRRWIETEPLDDDTYDHNPFSFKRCVRPYARYYGIPLVEALEAIRDEFRRRLKRRGAAAATMNVCKIRCSVQGGRA